MSLAWFSMIAPGNYRYEIRRGSDLIAVEEDVFEAGAIKGVRRAVNGSDVYEATATLDGNGRIAQVTARYSRGPFSRSATYDAGEEFMRGNVNAVGGRTVETAKLGRFREVDAGLVLFKALIVAHVRERAQSHWTGRVVTIDPGTLVARSQKQTCRRKPGTDNIFFYEPRMGDSEEIAIDERGVILNIRDDAGTKIVLAPSRADASNR